MKTHKKVIIEKEISIYICDVCKEESAQELHSCPYCYSDFHSGCGGAGPRDEEGDSKKICLSCRQRFSPYHQILESLDEAVYIAKKDLISAWAKECLMNKKN